jgi:glycine/D-amino acid oxidase-like deaminating enzyme
VVVGTGIHGAGVAYYLAAAGWRVLVLDAGEAGGGTSSATNANLSIHNRDPLLPDYALARTTLAMYAHLGQELDADLEFEPRGGLTVADDDETMRLLAARAARLRATGVRAEVLDGDGLRRVEPALGGPIAGGIYCPDSAWVNPMLVVRAYLRAVARRGGEIRTQTPVTGLRISGGRVVGVATPDGEVSTPLVINAAGPGAGVIARMAGVSFDITPVWGQLVVTEITPPHPVNHWGEVHVPGPHGAGDGYGVRFLATRVVSGNILIGRCEVIGEARRRVIPSAIRPVLDRASRFLPFLKDLRVIRVFAGIRPYSPDERPAIGRLPSLPGFAMLAGFGDKGIGLSAAPRLLAQALCDRTPDISLDPFDPGRFVQRALQGGHA